MVSGASNGLRTLWSWRRWIYAAWLAFAITRIPMRTGFHLAWPACDTRLTLENLGLSLTKVPHIVLFGIFFLLTVAQFDRPGRGALAWSIAATALMGLLIEIQEGATRTGNCRITDVAPDILGALIVAGLGVGAVVMRRYISAQSSRAREAARGRR